MKYVLLLLLLLTTPAFAITIEKVDLSEIEDDAILITGPVWDGRDAGPVLFGRFESSFDRTVASKLASGFRNAMIPTYTLASEVDLGEVLATALRTEGTKLGLSTMAPQEGKAPQWTVDGTIREARVDIQHFGYGSLLLYTYLDVDVRATKTGEPPVTHRIRPARLFVMYQGGMGMGDEVKLALEQLLLIGTHQILARLNREYFHAPVLSSVGAKLAGLKNLNEQEGDLHAIGISGLEGAGAALAARLESEKDENARTSIVYALTSLGAGAHVPLLARRYASEDDDVRYATIIAMGNAGTPEALALIRERGTKDKTVVVRKLSERLLGGG